MKSTGINILILGKTGVGKSSFCNYIFGEELFRTGVGKPVTDWNDHFRHEQIIHEGFHLNIFDSVGIETNNLSDWRSRLGELLKARNNNSDPNQWIHGGFYLINAASSRIERTEIELINNLAKEGIVISIILTNIDSAAKDVKDNLIENLKSHITVDALNIYEVCSVSIRKRSGVTFQSGKEEVLRGFLKNLDAVLCKKTSLSAIALIEQATKEMHFKIEKEVKDLDLGVIKLIKGAMQDALDDVFHFENDFLDDLAAKYEQYVEGFNDFLQKLGYEGNSITETSIDNLLSGLEYTMNDSMDKIVKRLDSLDDGLDSDSFFEQVKSVFKMSGVLLTLESTILESIDELFGSIYEYLNVTKHEIERTGFYIKDLAQGDMV